jgi:hypothetical protein
MTLKARHMTTATLLALLAVAAGCGRGQSTIPPGAQQVHVVVTDADVRLEPTTVSPGEVYLVLDAPGEGSIAFVEAWQPGAGGTAPLTDDHLARLARGDTAGTSIGGLDVGGCSPEQNAEDRGRLGPCGNVMMVVVSAGRYAIVGGDPEDAATGPPPPMAVLVVEP